MKYSKLNRQLVNLRVLLEHISEGNEGESGLKNSQLTMRLKVLFVINNNKNCSPSLLIDKLCIAKSNLAIICKGLIDEGLILSEKNEADKRNIYYNITPKGEEELIKFYNQLEQNILSMVNPKDLKVIEKKIDELTVILTKSISKKN